MKLTFEARISGIIAPYLSSYEFIQKENELYFYKNLDGIIQNIVVEKTDDNNANDAHQKFDIYYGIYSKHVQIIRGRNIEEFPKDYENIYNKNLRDLDDYNGQTLELKSNTDFAQFEKRLLLNLDIVMQIFAIIADDQSLLDFCAVNHRSQHVKEHFRRTKDARRMELFLKHEEENSSKINSGALGEPGIKDLVAIELRPTKTMQMNNFKPDFTFPEIWSKCCDWVDDMHYTHWMGAGFEHDNSGKNTLTHFIKEETIQNRFAVFGHTGDDSLFAVWKQDDGRLPVIYLGDGGTAKVITESIEDFIDLLAINYRDVEDANITIEPTYDDGEIKERFNNRAFRAFYTQTLNRAIQTTGAEIKARAETCDNLFDWLMANSAGFKEWNS
jgi:hypothetical protein